MKKIIFTLFTISIIFSNCKTSKTSTASAPTAEQKLAQAQTRWPDATTAQLNEGETILNNQCKRCHAIKPVSTYTEEQWGKYIEKMAPKAKITPEQKESLKRYVFTMKGLETK